MQLISNRKNNHKTFSLKITAISRQTKDTDSSNVAEACKRKLQFLGRSNGEYTKTLKIIVLASNSPKQKLQNDEQLKETKKLNWWKSDLVAEL